MTVPKSADVSGGIPNRSLKGYGNMVYGDCTVAAYFHVEMFKNIAKGSSFKKLLWKLGFHCPTNQDAVRQYTAFLATLNEKPSGSQGVYPNQFLDWQKSQGNVVAWAWVDMTNEDTVRQAMIDFHGVLMAGELTYNSLYNMPAEWVTGTTPHDVPLAINSHAVAFDHFTADFDECITWGTRQRMSPAYRQLCFTEGFVFLLTSEKDNPDFAEKLALIKTMPGASY